MHNYCLVQKCYGRLDAENVVVSMVQMEICVAEERQHEGVVGIVLTEMHFESEPVGVVGCSVYESP